MQLKLFLFQCGHECLDEGQALFGFLSVADKEFVVAMILEFRRLISESSPDALTDSKLRTSPGSIAVGKAFPSEILYQCEDFLELVHCPGDFFQGNGLRPHPFR